MTGGFSGLMLDASTAVAPLVTPEGARVVGLDGSEAHFAVPGGEIRVALPFASGDRFTVEACAVPIGDAARDLFLLLPDQFGKLEAQVSVEQDRGVWFAIAQLVPAGTSTQ